jgi:putative FmdB family regulatory protein
MPTYVYKCTTCNKKFEVQQSITEPPLTDCSGIECLGGKLEIPQKVERIIQPTVPIFTGKGFYQTDYKKKSE